MTNDTNLDSIFLATGQGRDWSAAESSSRSSRRWPPGPSAPGEQIGQPADGNGTTAGPADTDAAAIGPAVTGPASADPAACQGAATAPAASRALTMASATDSATARNSRSIIGPSSGSTGAVICSVPGACGISHAVEKAITYSPLPCSPNVPVQAAAQPSGCWDAHVTTSPGGCHQGSRAHVAAGMLPDDVGSLRFRPFRCPLQEHHGVGLRPGEHIAHELVSGGGHDSPFSRIGPRLPIRHPARRPARHSRLR